MTTKDKTDKQAPAEPSVPASATPATEAPVTPASTTQTAPSSDPVAVLEQKVAELQDKLLRMQAEFDNSRKRLQRNKEEAIRFANEMLLGDLLTVVDNFELGLQATETATDPKSIALGMQMVKTQLQRFLSDSGVQEISAIGQKFDPHLHEAIARVESKEHAEGIVLAQKRKGYKLRDRLLRPAMVTVSAPLSAVAAETGKH